MRKFCLIVLIFIKSSLAFAQETKPSLEDLRIRYKNSRRDSNAVKLLLKIDSIYLYKMPDVAVVLDSALLMAQQAKEISKSIHFERGYENAQFMMGNAYAEKGNMRSAISLMNGTRGPLKIRLLIMLGERYFFRPGELKQNLDSAYTFIVMARRTSETLHHLPLLYSSLCLMGKYHFAIGEYKQGKECFMRIIRDYNAAGNIEREAHWWEELGIYMPDSDSTFQDEIYVYTKALSLYRSINYKAQQPAILENLAFVYHLHNVQDSAIAKKIEALTIRKSLKQTSLYDVYVDLSKIYLATGNNQKALYYALAAVNNADSIGQHSMSAYLYFQLGEAYRAIGEHENSTNWYKKALKDLPSNHRIVFPVCGRIVDALLKQGKAKEALSFIEDYSAGNKPIRLEDQETVASAKGNCFNALHRYDLAEQNYVRMITFDNKQQEHFKTIGIVANGIEYSITGSEANYIIALFYVEQRKHISARPYLIKALSFKSAFAPSLSLQKDIHLLMFKVDSAQHDYLSAINHYGIHKRLNDSLFSDSKSKQIEELKIQYETNEKEKDFTLLQAKEQVQTKELQRSAQMRTYISLLALSLVVVLAIGFSRYRVKQKSNLLLRAQQIEINSQYLELTILNKAQEKLLIEKEWLVKEIHHRVKNNLQMIISLLNAQAEFLEHPLALNAIKESRERVQSVALIHQKLYQPGQDTFINMRAYVPEMVDYLKSGLVDVDRITFKLDIDEINLDVSQAVPLGLILNEAVTNAVKYAFPTQAHGTVTISLSYVNDEDLLLEIKDNGRGLPSDFDFANNNSLGMQLMQLLAEQLEGIFKVGGRDGVEISLTFRRFHPENRHAYLLKT